MYIVLAFACSIWRSEVTNRVCTKTSWWRFMPCCIAAIIAGLRTLFHCTVVLPAWEAKWLPWTIC